ncbi:MAG: hypothetical protein IPO27_16630 [Bacteroidetes bacterium]|nr:hypothetical protein [Bacteroidota bacterium]
MAVPFGAVQFVLSVDEQLTVGLDALDPTTASQVDVHPVVLSVTVTV